MGSALSLSSKSRSSKLLRSKSAASTSTPSALPAGSNDSNSGSNGDAHSNSPNPTYSYDGGQGQNIPPCKCSSCGGQKLTALSCFFDASTQVPQNFAFPASIMEYIAMNPSSAKVYLKLIRSCKYFFARNPILVIPALYHFHCDEAWHDQSSSLQCHCSWPKNRDGWQTGIENKGEIYISNPPCFLKDLPKNIKIWPTNTIFVSNFITPPAATASSLIPRIYRCDAHYLSLTEPGLSLDELKLLATNVTALECYWPLIKDENGADISLANIVPIFPKLKVLICYIRRIRGIPFELGHMFVPDAQKFQNLFNFDLNRNPDAFDINAFCEFMIENKDIGYVLYFHPFISQTLKDRIDACKNRLANEVYENDQKRPDISINLFRTNVGIENPPPNAHFVPVNEGENEFELVFQ